MFLFWILIILVILVVSNIKIVPQAHAYVIERLGAYSGTWGVGVHLLIPFIDRVAKRVTLKEQVVDFKPQPVITKDNVTMQIDTVVYFQITDPKLYTYGVELPMSAIENLTATTLRNIIGDMELDESLTSRDVINTKMRSILDDATDPWGIKVNRVELKNIIPPAGIREAMEKQMKAERERREAILKAEGEKKSAILLAEGEKESAILRADAQKQAHILEAEGEAQAKLKEAQAQIEIAKAQAEAKLIAAQADREAQVEVARAEAQAIQLKSIEIARTLGFTINETTITNEDGTTSIEYVIDFEGKTAEEIAVITDYLKYMEYLAKWDGELPNVMTDSSATIVVPTT